MNKRFFFIVATGLLLLSTTANAGFFDWLGGLFSQPTEQKLGASIIFPYQGGSGIGSATAGDVGKVLKVSDAYHFTYILHAANTGAGGGEFSWTQIYSGTINATSTTLGFLNGFISSGASSTISDALNLTNTKNCNTLDTDANGLLSCGTDEGSSVPNLVYKTFSGTKYFTASSSDALAFRFADGFVSSGASSTISDTLRLRGTTYLMGTVGINTENPAAVNVTLDGLLRFRQDGSTRYRSD